MWSVRAALALPWRTFLAVAALVAAMTGYAGAFVFAVATPVSAVVAEPGSVNNGLVAFGSSGIHVGESSGLSRRVLIDGNNADGQQIPVDWPAWSPDGLRLAFSRAGDLWVTDWRGLDERQVTVTAAFETEPAWSPDGATLAYVRDGQVWTASADGGAQHPVTDGCCASSPSWSPDGTRIAFASTKTGTSQVYVLDLSLGEPATALTEASNGSANPDWSPDGLEIAFTRFEDGGTFDDLWLMSADGSDQRPLVTGGSNQTDPAWAPDGTEIMYVVGQQIFYVGRDGTGVTYSGHFGSEPDWQPLAPCTITGTPGSDELVGTTGSDVICGGGGDDVIVGRGGRDIVLGDAGADRIGFPEVTSGVRVNLRENLATGDGEDMVLSVDDVTGSPGNDRLVGTNWINHIDGAGGDDLLAGDSGPDSLDGGPGSDTYISVNGPVEVDLQASRGLGGGERDLDTLASVENATGTTGEDFLVGDDGPNILYGGAAGRDRLVGGEGDDELLGSDQGGGIVLFADSLTPVRVDLAAGTAVGQGQDHLVRIGGVVGSAFDDTILGGGLDTDHLWFEGGPGDDRFLPRIHCGRFFGGAGTDEISFATKRGPVRYDARSSSLSDTTDNCQSHAQYLLDTEIVRGTSYGDILTGGPVAESLLGGPGPDRLSGRGGADLVVGDAGRDRLLGGNGSDRLRARDDTADYLDGGLSIDSCTRDSRDSVRRCP